MGDHLIVGVSSDESNWDKKQKLPIFPRDQRQKDRRCVEMCL